MTEFEKAQHKAVNALALLAETGSYDEALAVQRAMSVLHENIFAASFESVYQKSERFLQELNEDLGITDESSIRGGE